MKRSVFRIAVVYLPYASLIYYLLLRLSNLLLIILLLCLVLVTVLFHSKLLLLLLLLAVNKSLNVDNLVIFLIIIIVLLSTMTTLMGSLSIPLINLSRHLLKLLFTVHLISLSDDTLGNRFLHQINLTLPDQFHMSVRHRNQYFLNLASSFLRGSTSLVIKA